MQLARLGDVTDVVAGVGFPKGMQGRDNADVPVFKVGDISTAWTSGQRLLRSSRNSLTKTEAASLGRLVPAGATVFAKIGEALRLNRRAMLAQPSLVDNNVMALIPRRAQLAPMYLFYFMQTVDMGQLSRATAVPSIRKSDVVEIPIPVPPLADQEFVVAEIEKQFSRLDEAVGNLKRVTANLKRYKAAVLSAAVEGRLVPTEAEIAKHVRRTYETGGQLIERILESHRTKNAATKSKLATARAEGHLGELPRGWSWATLDQIRQTDKPIIYGIIKPGPHVLNGVPYVRVTEMKDGFVDVAHLKRTSIERAAKFARATLTAGDLLISKDGTIGRVAVVPSTLEGGNITQHVVRVSVTSLLDRDYVMWAIRSDSCQRWLTGETRGVALRGVNVEDFRRLPIPVPPIAEQIRIAQEVDRRLSIVLDLEREVEASQLRAAGLRRACLDASFCANSPTSNAPFEESSCA